MCCKLYPQSNSLESYGIFKKDDQVMEGLNSEMMSSQALVS